MRRSLRSWIWRVPLEQEVDEELGFHLEMLTRELVDGGMDPTAARAAAIVRLGDPTRVRSVALASGRKRDRQMRITQWMDEVRQDITFALRQLRGAPVFAAVAALTLALGIGANSAVFALVDAVLLRPLPFHDPDRLVMVWETSNTSSHGRVSPPDMIDWADRSRSFEKMAGFFPGVGGMVMSGADGTAETVSRQWVTAGFFDVLGVRPIAGRTFLQTDQDQRANVVVLNEAFWRARFGADPSIIGRVVPLDGMPFTIVGVVPSEFQLFGRTSMWGMVPIDRRPQMRAARIMQTIARMKAGAALETATADLQTVAAGLASEFPATNAGRGVAIEPLRDALIGSDLRLTSMLFLGVVGFVQLISCANVANLLLARATARTREMGIRSALGAGRRRVVRQLLTESLVIATIGGALGIGVGVLILHVAPMVIPRDLLPPAVSLHFDYLVMLFCAAASLLVGLVFGLAPAWQTSGRAVSQALVSDSRTSTGTGGRLRSLLVAGEVATAVLLLIGAGLLLRTLLAVERVDRGYRADQVLTMMVDPLGSEYPTAARLLGFFGDVERELAAVPGIRNVAWTSDLPMSNSEIDAYAFEIVGESPGDVSKRPPVSYQIASTGYFQALDLPIVEGRSFNDYDTADSPPVCIVSEAFVRGYLQGRSPIGAKVSLRAASSTRPRSEVREIVGVAHQVKARPDETEDQLQLYVPMTQGPSDDIFLAVRPKAGRAAGLTSAVRSAIGRVDKKQLVGVRDIQTLEDVAREATERHRFRAITVITFAALALLLAVVGVFGILAYSVQQRERDFAVRRALGATSRDVLTLVVRTMVPVVAGGAAIGLLLSMVVGRLLTTMLFGVEPLDAVTFGVVTAVIGLTAAAATAAPAWRAVRIDPAVALKTP